MVHIAWGAPPTIAIMVEEWDCEQTVKWPMVSLYVRTHSHIIYLHAQCNEDENEHELP